MKCGLGATLFAMSLFAQERIPLIGRPGIHSYNEDVDIEDVVNAAKIYAATICDLLV
jgi:hypothetical protein